MPDQRVFVVGSLNADHRVRVPRIPSGGETVLGADIVVSAGGGGAFVASAGLVEHVEATPVSVVDTTAAGDTFIGYLAATLATGPDDVIRALRRAVRAAGITVTRPGAVDSIPHFYEIATAATSVGTKGFS
jgi:ribokinase